MSSFYEAVKRAAENDCFGGEVLEKIELDVEKQKGFQLASNLFFVKVLIGGKEKSLVVKTQPFHRRNSEVNFRDSLFVNEVCFYNDLLPFLSNIDINIKNIFPNYVYGCATISKDVSKDTVIVEDISPLGYCTSKIGKNLDVEHITLALRALGRYHALSYKAKKENPLIFRRLLTSLVNDMKTMEEFIAAALYSAPECYKGSSNNIEALKEACCKDPLKKYQNSIIPKEPNAVLCHGDFCSNNMLFLYKENKPIDVKFVDMQRCRYASPAIDLSFFLLYNTTAKTKSHWDFFLHIYYESLRNAYEDVIVPSFSEFMQDFIDHIFYGVSTCSYFLKVSTMPIKELNAFLLMERSEKTKYIGSASSEEALTLIDEMLQLLLNKKYL